MSEEAYNVNDIWSKACVSLKQQLSIDSFQQWFHCIVPVSIGSGEIILGVSDDFFADWLNEHYGDILSAAVKSAVGNETKVKFETGYYLDETEQAELDKAEKLEEEASEEEQILNAPFLSPQNCRSEYTFDNFVVGEENRYAHAAAITAAKSPGVYNPLYIHGSSGIGKTHLIQAVAHEVLRKNPKANVRYMTCESFLNQYVDSLKMNKHSEFRNFIRNVDVLLVDDVHQLANKIQLQEEFFNTFNSLYNHNKQIILTSDKQPCEIQGLEDRLVSRFASGVTTEITKPSFETRLAILKMKQEKHLLKLDENVLQFLAGRITSSVRMLVGSLIRLVAFSSAMANCKITIDIAESLLNREIEKETVGRKISIDLIQRKVAEFYDIRLNDILSKKRPKNIAEPRMVAMYLCRKMTEHSLPEIGAAFGKNHATVIHAIGKVEEDLKNDETTRRNLSSLQRQLQS